MRVRPFYMMVSTPTGGTPSWMKEMYLRSKPMQEDNREKVRLASDVFQLDKDVALKALEAFRVDRLTVLNLTERDKLWLKDLRVGI